MIKDASAYRVLSSCPRLSPGVRWQKLPLTPQEGFLLSRIDGHSCVELLAHMTALHVDLVVASLAHLAELGAIEWDGPQVAAPRPVVSGAPVPLDEPCDLSTAQKEELLRLERDLARLTHWQVLGIQGDTSPAAIKRAYYAQARRFHPDRYFGMNLGSFRARLERVFMALKVSYEVLADEQQRRAYAALHPPPRAESRP